MPVSAAPASPITQARALSQRRPPRPRRRSLLPMPLRANRLSCRTPSSRVRWCWTSGRPGAVPCRAELPHLEALSHKYQGQVAFYGMNSSDPPKITAAFAKQNGLTFPMLSDADHHVAVPLRRCRLYSPASLSLIPTAKSAPSPTATPKMSKPSCPKTLDALLSEEKRTP